MAIVVLLTWIYLSIYLYIRLSHFSTGCGVKELNNLNTTEQKVSASTPPRHGGWKGFKLDAKWTILKLLPAVRSMAVRRPQQRNKVQNTAADKRSARIERRRYVWPWVCFLLPRAGLELSIARSAACDVMRFRRRRAQTDGPGDGGDTPDSVRPWHLNTTLARQQRGLPQNRNLRFGPASCYWAAQIATSFERNTPSRETHVGGFLLTNHREARQNIRGLTALTAPADSWRRSHLVGAAAHINMQGAPRSRIRNLKGMAVSRCKILNNLWGGQINSRQEHMARLRGWMVINAEIVRKTLGCYKGQRMNILFPELVRGLPLHAQVKSVRDR